MSISHKSRTESNHIRLARISDVEAITTLDKTVFGSIDGGYPDFFFGHMISMYPSTFWVLEDIMAYCLVTLGENTPWLYSIAVHPAYQDKSIGTRMIGIAERYLKRKNYMTLCLYVDISNTRAIALYTKLHYRIIDKRDETKHIRLLMRKVL